MAVRMPGAYQTSMTPGRTVGPLLAAQAHDSRLELIRRREQARERRPGAFCGCAQRDNVGFELGDGARLRHEQKIAALR